MKRWRLVLPLALVAVAVALKGAGKGWDESGSTPWRLVEVSGDGRTVLVEVKLLRGEGIEAAVTGVEVDETATEVRVAVVAGHRYPDHETGWVSDTQRVEVPLGAPLGERRLVHAPVAGHYRDLASLLPADVRPPSPHGG